MLTGKTKKMHLTQIFQTRNTATENMGLQMKQNI